MSHHAQGTFTVDVHPLTPPPAEGLGRFSIDKQIHGDLEAASRGEIEVVTGALAGKHGSFAFQHLATMDQSGLKMQVMVVPGSGTGELKGITGTFSIKIEGGQHFYDFEYTLPGQ